jgi:hypothetical protein
MGLSLKEVLMPVLSRACPEPFDLAQDKLCRRVEGLIDAN